MQGVLYARPQVPRATLRCSKFLCTKRGDTPQLRAPLRCAADGGLRRAHLVPQSLRGVVDQFGNMLTHSSAAMNAFY